MFQSHFARLAVPALIALAGAQAFAADYKVDPAHSRVGFSVRHLMVAKVRGSFKDFEGTFTFDPAKGTLGATNFVVKTASVDTDDAKRDEHLRTADFFDVEKYPTMTMTNNKITKKGKNKYKWTGDLTLHGVTKPVTFDMEYVGSTKDPWGNQKAGFAATGKINRKDFGLNWNKNLDGGGVVVGDEVEITLDIEAVEQAAQAAAAPAASPAAAPAASPAKK